MKVKKKINKHRNWAINAMKEKEECRNNDWELLITVLRNNGVEISDDLKYQILSSGVNYHTLLRERQKIQREGKLLPTNPTILEKRRLLSVAYTKYYSKN